MKILEITNVDFSLRHFLLPLMRALRTRGHDVVGVCAEGPLLADVRAEGFRVIAAPFARRVSPLAHWRAFNALVVLMRAERPDLVHAHMPISSFLARLAAWRAGVPRIAFTCHGFLFNNAQAAWPQRTASFAMEWLGGRVTDVFLTVSTEEAADARRLGIAALQGGEQRLMLAARDLPGLRRIARDERARARDEGSHPQPERFDQRRERLVVGHAVDLEMKRPIQFTVLLAVVDRDRRAHRLVQ